MNPYPPWTRDKNETVEIPYIFIYEEGELIKEIECSNVSYAKTKLTKLLGQGKCAIIKKKIIPYDDYIPF
jgi:hypothetical protein